MDRHRHASRRLPCVAGTLLAVLAAGSVTIAERPRIYAITGATVVTAPGRSVDNGTVVIRDGLIEAVGAGVAVPADAVEIDATGRYVYPGLIDADSALGRGSSGGGETPGGGRGAPGEGARRGGAERTGAVHPIDRIHPESRVLDDLRPFSGADATRELSRYRELGFTAALTTPEDGILRGRSAALLLAADRPVAEVVLAADVAQHASFARAGGFGGGYPNSLMGIVAALRQAFLDADRYRTWSTRYATDPSGLPRPPRHASFEALLPVLDRRQRLVVHASEPDDALLADRLAREFDLDLTIVGSGHEWEIAPALARAGRTLILPVAFPDKPDVKDPDDALSVSLRTMRRFTGAAEGPRVLHEAGVRFALTTHTLKNPADFPKNMREIVEAGLPFDTALAALTTVPAELLGLSRSLGTLEAGKIANLFIADGPLFAKDTRLRRVFVDGVSHEIEVKEKPQGDPDAVVDPRGTWSVVFEIGSRTITREWTIEGGKDAYTGRAETRQGTVDIESIDLKGNVMTVVLPSPRGTQEITVIVEGDTFEGEVELGSRTTTVSGTRTRGPGGGVR